MRFRVATARGLVGAVLSVAVVLSWATTTVASVSEAAAAPQVDRTVGALFFPSAGGLGPALGLPHTCTASVVHSATHDLVLTAAHCMLTPGTAFQFAPGYTKGLLPFGLWTVAKVFVNPAWNKSHDALHDYAFLRVAPKVVNGVTRRIEDVTGANTLGSAPPPATTATVTAYKLGSNDDQFTCTAATYLRGVYPAFDCAGFVGGTSGGPWLVGALGSRSVVGVIGGLEQGGCTATTTYSSPFGADTMQDFHRAQTQIRSDSVSPLLGGDC